MATVKESLIAAKALIDTPEKWAKGLDIKPEKGRFCAAVACNGFLEPAPMFSALIGALPDPWQMHPGFGVTKVFWFNDHPDTTHADIMALFDRAIAAQDGAP